MIKVLIIGFGSIGGRHSTVLSGLGCKVAVVTKRDDLGETKRFSTIEDGVKNWKPDYCLITNETSLHYESLGALAKTGFSGIVLVEKPIFHELSQIPQNGFKTLLVGYHLRVNPVIQYLRDQLHHESLCSLQCYVGQYLPTWRPGTDYRYQYSALRAQGGGVILDLSHEFDYLIHLLGDWKQVAALSGHYSTLEIDTEDCVCILSQFESCPAVTIQLNYLDFSKRRELLINTSKDTIHADLIKGTVKSELRCGLVEFPKIDMYEKLHQSILSGHYENLATGEDGIKVLKFIDAVKTASGTNQWIRH